MSYNYSTSGFTRSVLFDKTSQFERKKMERTRYAFAEEIPISITADVIVAGGGPGGLGAAVMAARAGADTALVERYGFLGGMASSGEISPFMWNHVKGRCLDRPVYAEWVERMHSYLPASMREGLQSDTEITSTNSHILSKDIAMLAMEDLCLDARVRIIYHHSLADVIVKERRIDSIILLSKSGFAAAKAKVFVDCTGDADLAAKAGCEFEIGGPDGYAQPMTLCFKLSHVDRERMPKREELNRLYLEAKANGIISNPREDVLIFNTHEPDIIHFNTTRIIRKNGADGMDLSDAEIEGRRQLREMLAWLRMDVPGFETAMLHSVAHHVGVRESRRVKGIAYLEREAFTNAQKFPDAIARVNYPIDIHNPVGTGTELVKLPENEFYEIPYGCVVPKDVDNLTVGGRPISVDHAIHSSMRVMTVACSVGQAAGMAAAMCIRRNVPPVQLSGAEVRKALIEQGAALEKGFA